MTKKDEKKFDCVKMKEQAQARLNDEYEMRKNEFASYGEFLKAKMNESIKMKQFWDSLGPQGEKASA